MKNRKRSIKSKRFVMGMVFMGGLAMGLPSLGCDSTLSSTLTSAGITILETIIESLLTSSTTSSTTTG